MRSILFALAAVAAGTALHAGAAQAQNYPYCLLSGPGPGDCRYSTYAQCQATASGTGYYCQPNYALRQSYGAQGYGYGRTPRARYYGPQY